MSDAIYLERLQARQFRSFTELDIQIEAAPGVLIVQGSNGLGKSSLFHGVEWLLTDQIDHFRHALRAKQAGRYLCRWKKPAGEATAMAMTFSDGQTLTRTLATRRARLSKLEGVSDIAKYLKRSDWEPKIKDLSHYLLLTHVLSQANLSRFSYRGPGERFDILQDAARSETEDRIGKNLHGLGSTLPARAFKTVADQLTRDRDELQELLSQEARTFSEAQISGALDDDAAEALALRIRDRLNDAGLMTAPDSGDANTSLLATELERAGELLRERAAALANARRLRGEFGEAGESLVAATGALTSTSAAIDMLPATEAEAEAARAALSPQLSSAEQSVRDSGRRIERLDELKTLQAREKECHAQSLQLNVMILDWAARHRAADLFARREERRAGFVDRLDAELSVLDGHLESIEHDVNALQAIVEVHGQLDQASSQFGELETANPDWQQALETARQDLEKANGEVDRLTPLVEDLREATDAISAAVVSLVSHLPDETCACPVCDTRFAEPAAFWQRAQTAAARLAPLLEQQQADLDSAVRIRDLHAAEVRRHVATFEVVSDARASLEIIRQDWIARLQTVNLVANDQAMGQVLATIAMLRTERDQMQPRRDQSRRRRMVLTRNGTFNIRASAAEQARNRDQALAGLQAAERQRTELQSRLDVITPGLSRLITDIFGRPDATASEISHESEAVRAAAEAAKELYRNIQENVASAERQRDQLKARRSTLEAEQGALKARVADLETRRTVLSGQWAAVASVGDIDEAGARTLVQADLALAHMQASVAEAGVQLSTLRDGRVAWSRQQGHAEALSRLRERVDGALNSGREDLRLSAENLRARSDARLTAVTRAKQIASAASDTIASELDEFNAEYIKPLSHLMTRINRTILCDPRIGIELKVNARKINQASVKEGELPADLGDVDPLLVHSEGQMAALAVSLLCAASLTFPWSRWKALVLDDPLQHNDAIHASAFADFIGNLVEAESYQVLLSTHEVAQAEFLERKFRARGIPCTTVNLIGMGAQGVEEVINGPAEIRARHA